MATLDTSYLRTLLEPARDITILIGGDPDFDTVAASLGFKVSLENTGKNIRVICPDNMLVEFNRLVGVDSITSVFGSRNLVISFPGQTEHVDKVSYNLEKGELQLVISPKAEAPDLDHRQLKFVSGSGKTDLIILMNVNELADLKHVYKDAQDHFQKTTLISISHGPTKENYTLHQFHDRESSSLSEFTTHIINSLGLPLDSDASSNLLHGLEKATANFQSPGVSASTFEAAVILMRKGAKRHVELSASDFPIGSIPGQVTPPPTSPPPVSPQPTQPATQNTTPTNLQGYGTDNTEDVAEIRKSKSNEKKAPADWYEPKIYKGPMLP